MSPSMASTSASKSDTDSFVDEPQLFGLEDPDLAHEQNGARDAQNVFDALPQRHSPPHVPVQNNAYARKQTFASLFKENRAPTDALMLEYVQFSGGNIDIGFDEIDSIDNNFGFSLLGCVPGFKPSVFALQNLIRSWGIDAKFQIHMNGWIIFTFASDCDRDAILHGGQYMLNGRYLYLKLVPPCFLFRAKDMDMLPSWIQIHGLPTDCWTNKLLGRIASVVGKPIHMDNMTHTRKRKQYARILVEVDARVDKIRELSVNLPTGVTIKLFFTYENEAQPCELCMRFGHDSISCRRSNTSSDKSKNPSVSNIHVNAVTNHDETVPIHDCDGAKPHVNRPESRAKSRSRGRSRKHGSRSRSVAHQPRVDVAHEQHASGVLELPLGTSKPVSLDPALPLTEHNPIDDDHVAVKLDKGKNKIGYGNIFSCGPNLDDGMVNVAQVISSNAGEDDLPDTNWINPSKKKNKKQQQKQPKGDLPEVAFKSGKKKIVNMVDNKGR